MSKRSESQLAIKARKLESRKQSFIAKAKELYGDKYNYDQVDYDNNKTNVTVRCNHHRDFFIISPDRHLRGQICPKCTREKSCKTKEKFVLESQIKHGEDKYDYSDFVYVNSYTRGKILCREHGYFYQIPRNHVNGGTGCPVCSASSYEQEVWKLFKSLGISFEMEYKLPEVGSKYRYDFYLPDYRLLIELHGKQHYLESWGGKELLEKIKTRDAVKRNLAQGLGYNLIEFNLTGIRKEGDLPLFLLLQICDKLPEFAIRSTPDNKEHIKSIIKRIKLTMKLTNSRPVRLPKIIY